MRRRVIHLLATGAWLSGIAAIYVAAFAVGARIWSYAAFAAGLLLVAGLLRLGARLAQRSDTRVWAFGTVQVAEVSAPPQNAIFGRCEMQVIVDAPGRRRRKVKVRDPRVPVDLWPEVGSILPAQIGVPSFRKVIIQWDRVPSSSLL